MPLARKLDCSCPSIPMPPNIVPMRIVKGVDREVAEGSNSTLPDQVSISRARLDGTCAEHTSGPFIDFASLGDIILASTDWLEKETSSLLAAVAVAG